MPKGLLILQWSDRAGPLIIAKYPENADERISRKSLLQVYNMHQFNQEEDCAWLSMESANFISYYSGRKKNISIVLILNILENPEDYEKVIRDISKVILSHFEDDSYISLLPEIFTKIPTRSLGNSENK